MKRVGEMRNAFNSLIEKSERQRPLGKRRSVQLESILIRMGGGELIHVIQGEDKLMARVTGLIIIRVYNWRENFDCLKD